MGNSRLKERFELALDTRQVIAVLLGSMVILGGVFVLGMSVGRQATTVPAAPIAAPKDALARLDEPVASREEPAPELKAHQALTDVRSFDQTLPVPHVKATTVAIAPAAPPKARPEETSPPPPQAPNPFAAPAPLEKAAAAPVPAPAATPGVASTAVKPGRAEPMKPPRSAARAVPSAKRGAYAIQVASVPRRADAERLARRYDARHPRIVTADVPGKGRWYRVLIGAFETQDAAKRQLATLTRSGVHGIVTAVR